jgi:hypothetical protein
MNARALALLGSLTALLPACGDDEGRTTVTATAVTITTQPTSLTITTDNQTATTTPEGTTGDDPTGGGTLATDSGASATGTTTTTGPGTTSDACTDADCPMGQYCDGVACVPGCNDDADCSMPAVCDTGSHTCVGCTIDGNCPLGQVCSAGMCVPGCTDQQPCQDGLACCAGGCVDPLTDVAHCGGCDQPCPDPNNAAPTCAMGSCGLGPCDMGFVDCDKDPNNGCEVQGSCQCDPGSMAECYTGPMGTDNVGICKKGLHTCNPQGTGYGPCMGEVLPNDVDVCANGLDDNCNGQTDEDPDEDGDGYTVCGGDCCDAVGPNCLNPELVSPGAFEVMGNMVDDDCDGVEGNVVPACDQGLASNSANALDYAKAIDLCQFTTENAMGKDKKWGVISATLSRANGAGSPDSQARSIRPGFGTNVVPQQNASLAVLSTGNAADQNDANPPYADFQTGKDNGANSAAPADWLAANGGNFPNAPGCPAPGSTQANNSVMLKVRVRVPTNAKSFNVQMYFYSAEWPEYVCTAFNDLFVTLVDSTGVGNPNDKNIAIYTTQQNQKYPVGVNIAKAAPGLFTQCLNGPIACLGVQSNYNGCTGTQGLAGTGFQIAEGGCGANNTTGGGTGWLKMAGNVKGGEVMEIRFAIWDTADGIYDSLVLLDDWVWSVQASQPGVQPN